MAYPHINGGYLEYNTSGFPIVGGRADNVLEDFEDQSLSEYGSPSGWQIQGTNVLRGRYSLESLNENVDIGDSGGDIPTPRQDPPVEYRCRMLQEDAGRAGMLVNVQSETNAWRNAYSVMVDTENNQIMVGRHEDGTAHWLDTDSGGGHPQAGTEYIPAITTSTTGVKASLYDRSGSLLLETDSVGDTTHSGGGLGWDNWEGTTVYFDQATYGPGTMGEIQGTRTWIDDFEDGKLSEYITVSGSGQAGPTPSAAFKGNYGLEMINGYQIQSTPGSGLPNYLRSGNEILMRMNFQTGGSQQYWFPFCMQDISSTDNRYRLEFLMNGGFRVRKTKGGSSSTLSGTSSEDRDYAALYDLSHSTGSWYSAVLLVDQNYGIYAEMHDAGNNIKGWVYSPDTEFISSTNGIGFRSSGSGHVYFDHLFEIDQQYYNDTGRSEPIPHSDAPQP